jgi:Rieske 2Fe-2S family protein
VPLHGIGGLPFVDLTPLLDTAPLAAIDAEIALGLTRVQPSYTGGTLKWMGVCAPPVLADGHADAMHVLQRLSPAELACFAALGDAHAPAEAHVPTGDIFGPRPDGAPSVAYGDETDRPFTKAQMLWLKYRHGVYFPWKVAYHFLENERWEDKNSGEGKGFRAEARRVFPLTVAYLEALPFREIGRALVFGLESNDHAPLHRDTVPSSAEIDHCITIAPCPGKRFYLGDLSQGRHGQLVHKHFIPSHARLYWFNDMDWHGVEADPFFRYSIRVDGVFEPDFLARVKAHVAHLSDRTHPARAPRATG